MESKVRLTLKLNCKSKKRQVSVVSEYSRRRDAVRGLKRMLRAYDGKIINCYVEEEATSIVYELKQIKGGSAVFTKRGDALLTRVYKFPSSIEFNL